MPSVVELAYQLVRRRASAARTAAADPPELDEQQRRVVEHPGGPLLVLAGPGTGKTTTIVESVVDRIEARGVDPERVLVLTFSRKAAVELRERITARTARTTREPLALTFHSYAYALLRRESVLAGDGVAHLPRLLSGPEHLLEVRRLLAGEAEDDTGDDTGDDAKDGAGPWPPRLRPALRTRGFAEELRDFLLRAGERGLDAAGLIRLGRRHDRDDWVAAGRFLRRYADRFAVDPVPAYDYGELIRAAAAWLEWGDVRRRERAARQVVFVDEYQDTDPAQERLLAALAGDGHDLVAVGDPDQSIYGFRGADVRGISAFPRRFRTADGDEAPVVELGTSRRGGTDLLEASRRVARRLPAAPGGNRHRVLAPADGVPAGECRILVADSASQEAALVADALRRAHLVDDVPWSRMAVLVRSAVRQVPALRRALAAAGVPAVVAGDEVPLAGEPGIRPLLALLRCALRPETLDEATAEELLCGPLGGTDALGVRRLRRALRAIDDAGLRVAPPPAAGDHAETSHRSGAGEPDAGTDPPGDGSAPSRPGAEDPASPGGLIVGALWDSRQLILVRQEIREPADRIADLLRTVRTRVEAGGNAEEVLWETWRRCGLAERWLAANAAGGERGAAADRDLDAAVALFEAAARFVDRLPHAGPEVFFDDIAAQEIPGDTLAEQSPTGDAVRVLTAHRAKGLEWDVVCVAGVQEGAWPDLRTRGSLLGTDAMVEFSAGDGTDGGDVAAGGGETPAAASLPASLTSKLLDEERRLFYVAVTRARRRLVVTAAGGEDGEERPSRFLDELVPGSTEARPLRGGFRWLSLPALVADLRAVVVDSQQPAPLRRIAARRLAGLASAGVRGAHPRAWYALTTLSDDSPLLPERATVRVSPSQVEGFQTCGLRWLLESAVGARSAEPVTHLGSLIHALAALADAVEGSDLAGMGRDDLVRRLDEAMTELDFGSPWFNRRQREWAEQMLDRFLAWRDDSGRELVSVEAPFDVRLDRVRVVGQVDRVERDDRGRAVVVDLKTGSSRPADDEVPRLPQLGVYQLAILLDGFKNLGLTDPGGAELVQLGRAGFTRKARIQPQLPLSEDDDPTWARELIRDVGSGMAGSTFAARMNDGCRHCPVRSCCPVHDEGGQVTP